MKKCLAGQRFDNVYMIFILNCKEREILKCVTNLQTMKLQRNYLQKYWGMICFKMHILRYYEEMLLENSGIDLDKYRRLFHQNTTREILGNKTIYSAQIN